MQTIADVIWYLNLNTTAVDHSHIEKRYKTKKEKKKQRLRTGISEKPLPKKKKKEPELSQDQTRPETRSSSGPDDQKTPNHTEIRNGTGRKVTWELFMGLNRRRRRRKMNK